MAQSFIQYVIITGSCLNNKLKYSLAIAQKKLLKHILGNPRFFY